MVKATPQEPQGSFGLFLFPIAKEKGVGPMKKEQKIDRRVIISYRRHCVSGVNGTGLSHYIMFEDGE
jgi:hypothetical protein